jgi:hypothetical protein
MPTPRMSFICCAAPFRICRYKCLVQGVLNMLTKHAPFRICRRKSTPQATPSTKRSAWDRPRSLTLSWWSATKRQARAQSTFGRVIYIYIYVVNGIYAYIYLHIYIVNGIYAYIYIYIYIYVQASKGTVNVRTRDNRVHGEMAVESLIKDLEAQLALYL